MKIVEKNENQIVFTAEIEDSLANSIRRYINEIPVPAIDEIEISRNDSPLYDETIAHRMGLIPLKADKTVKEKTTAKLELNSKKEGMVYSGEMTGNIKVVYDKIPITSLNKGQELEITATVKAGKGSEHSKFSPGFLYYRNVLEIIMDEELKNEIKSACLYHEIKEKGKKIMVMDNKKNEILDTCEEISLEHGKKPEVEPKDDLIITLESFGQMEAKDIFINAIEILKKDLSGISKKIK